MITNRLRALSLHGQMGALFMLTFILCVASMGGAESLTRNEPLLIRAVTAEHAQVPCYGKFELTIDLSATYENPFDPDDVLVSAEFTSPKGNTVRIDGFYFQEYTRKLVDGHGEVIEPIGAPVWKIRFTPTETGTWHYQVSARDRSGTVCRPTAAFKVTRSSLPGFIRRSTANPQVFAYENGKPYFPVGLDMAWSGGRGSFEYDEWLPKLHQAGGNWIRLWSVPWHCGMEWSAESKDPWRNGNYHNLGVYSLDNAWKLDTILDMTERNGINVMLCLGTYSEFTAGGYWNEGIWKANPYNVANGGPCRTPEEFWTNNTARKLYQRRLHYLVARYGYRTNLHAWELWNEVNAPVAWVGEMARYLKSTGEFAGTPGDPYRHLLTTTYGDDAVWKLPEVDFAQNHHYDTGNIPDQMPIIYQGAREKAPFGKPYLLAELGIDCRKSDIEYDPDGQGVNLHNALWTSLVSGSAGTTMLWWWDNYVNPKNLWSQYTPVRAFADTIPWTTGRWQPVSFDAPEIAGPETYHDLTLLTDGFWWKEGPHEFTLTPSWASTETLFQAVLYPGKVESRPTPIFHVQYPQPGRFELRVTVVSAVTGFRITLDGAVAKEITLSATPPADPAVKPEYVSTELLTQYGFYQAVFDKKIGIDVPAGQHTISLEAVSGNWLSVDSITLTGYRSSRYPELRQYGLTNGRMAIFWVQNPQHSWKNVFEHKAILPITGATTAMHGLPDGRYTIEWWNSTTGMVTKRETARCEQGRLPLHLPDIDTDIAARIVPERHTR